MRGLYQLEKGKNAPWYIRYADATGKIRREKIGRKSDGIALLNKRKTEVLQRKKLPENFRTTPVTFEALCKDALAYCSATNAPKSSYELKLKIDEMLPVFGTRSAEEITKQEIMFFLTREAKARNWKPSSQNRWQAAFSLIFRVGMDNEKVTKNPAAGIRRKTENNSRVRFLSLAEEALLREAIPAAEGDRFRAAFDLSIHTGMRASEQYGLRWDHVLHLDGRSVLYLPKTKNGNARHIPLNAAALASLEVLRSDRATASGLVFPSSRTLEHAQGPRGWFTRAVERAGIADYTWHCNRHTFASRLVMAGVDLRTVGELMGHKSPAMTWRYAHLAASHNQSAVDRLMSTDTRTDIDQMDVA